MELAVLQPPFTVYSQWTRRICAMKSDWVGSPERSRSSPDRLIAGMRIIQKRGIFLRGNYVSANNMGQSHPAWGGHIRRRGHILEEPKGCETPLPLPFTISLVPSTSRGRVIVSAVALLPSLQMRICVLHYRCSTVSPLAVPSILFPPSFHWGGGFLLHSPQLTVTRRAPPRRLWVGCASAKQKKLPGC